MVVSPRIFSVPAFQYPILGALTSANLHTMPIFLLLLSRELLHSGVLLDNASFILSGEEEGDDPNPIARTNGVSHSLKLVAPQASPISNSAKIASQTWVMALQGSFPRNPAPNSRTESSHLGTATEALLAAADLQPFRFSRSGPVPAQSSQSVDF